MKGRREIAMKNTSSAGHSVATSIQRPTQARSSHFHNLLTFPLKVFPQIPYLSWQTFSLSRPSHYFVILPFFKTFFSSGSLFKIFVYSFILGNVDYDCYFSTIVLLAKAYQGVAH